jgi:hypothetical protein
LAVVDAGAIGQQVVDRITQRRRHVCFQPFGQGLAQFDRGEKFVVDGDRQWWRAGVPN